jgi:putative transposase
VLLRLADLGVTNVFALLRLLPMSSRDKDTEILALRHQLSVLQRQLGPNRARFTPGDRALLAALLHRLPRDLLNRLHLLVRPDTVLRWHRDSMGRRHARRSRPRHPGRPRTVARSASWRSAWSARIPGGDIAGCTANCWCSG